MATLVLPKSYSPTWAKQSLRAIAAPGGSYVVLDANGNPAVGRKVLVLGRPGFGSFAVVAETVTGAGGTFSVSINAGPNDRFVVVVLGDLSLGEYSVALHGVEAVP